MRILRAVIAAVLVSVGAVAVGAAAPAALPPAAGQFVSLTPARVVAAQTVAANAVYTLSPLGRGGVPATGVSAVQFHLSARGSGTGSLTVFPAGTARPTTSNVNYTPNRPTTDAVVAKLGTGGAASIANNGAAAVTIYVDVTGYYLAAGTTTSGAGYVPLTPTRLVSAQAVPAAGSVAVAPLGRVGVPSTGVDAVVAHVIVRSTTGGYATVYPDGVTRPTTSDLNYGSDYYTTNLVTAKLGANGQFRVFTTSAATVYVDVVGYYHRDSGSTFTAVAPVRTVTAVRVAAGATYSLAALGQGGVPAAGVTALAFTLTAVGTVNGGLMAFPEGITRPFLSSLYVRPAGYWPVLQTVKLGANGRVSIFNGTTAEVRIWVDVAGYFTSSATPPGAPTGVIAKATDGGAVVTWQPPAATGGAPVTSYTVTASPGGGTAEVVDTTTAVVGNLANGTAYTFTVKANNVAGAGPASTPSAAVTPKPPTPPGSPQSVTATRRFGGVIVRWSRPAADGGLPLTGYTVRAQPGGATVTVDPATAQADLALTNGTAYQFTVTATNAKGAGPASAPTPAVTPGVTVPDAPRDVAAGSTGDTVAITWTAPVYDGGQAVSGYTVTASPGGRTVTVAGGVTEAEVTGLTAGTEYTFVVVARNASGAGPASTPSKPTSPDFALTPQGRFLTETAAATLTTVTGSTLTFTSAPAQVTGLQAGNVVIVGSATPAPYGLVRTVTAVSTSGATTTVTTADAELTDAFADGGLSLVQRYASDGAALRALAAEDAPLIEVPLNQVDLGRGVTVNGKVSYDPTFDFNADWWPPSVSVDETDTVKLDVSLKAAFEDHQVKLEKQLWQDVINRRLNSVKFGKLAKLRPMLEGRLVLYVEGSVSAGMEASASTTQYVMTKKSEDGGSTLEVRPGPTEFKPPVATENAAVKMGVRAELALSLLGEDAVKVDTSAYAESTVDVMAASWWTAKACASVNLTILPVVGDGFARGLGPVCAEPDTVPGPLATFTMTPADVPLAQGQTVQLQAAGVIYKPTPTWSVVGTGNGTVTADGRYTAPMKNGFFEVLASAPATGIRPAMVGKARIRVGAPGPATVTVSRTYVVAFPEGFFDALDGTLTPSGPAADTYRMVPEPLEPDAFCYGWDMTVSGSFTLYDYAKNYLPLHVECGLLDPGGTYRLAVQGSNAYGPGPVTRTAPFSILPRLPNRVAQPATISGPALGPEAGSVASPR